MFFSAFFFFWIMSTGVTQKSNALANSHIAVKAKKRSIEVLRLKITFFILNFLSDSLPVARCHFTFSFDIFFFIFSSPFPLHLTLSHPISILIYWEEVWRGEGWKVFFSAPCIYSTFVNILVNIRIDLKSNLKVKRKIFLCGERLPGKKIEKNNFPLTSAFVNIHSAVEAFVKLNL